MPALSALPGDGASAGAPRGAGAPRLPELGGGCTLSLPRLEVRADRILRIQGYADLDRVRSRIREAAERAAALGSAIARAEVVLRRLRVAEAGAGRIALDDGTVLRCEAFDRHLAGCESVLAFVLSTGAAYEQRIEALVREDRPVDALFLDGAGWMAVESATRQLTKLLDAAAAPQRLRLTRRLGPGYRYRLGTRMVSWDLEQQHALFRAVEQPGGPHALALPARLLESAAMLPRMSRSGLFGLRPARGA